MFIVNFSGEVFVCACVDVGVRMDCAMIVSVFLGGYRVLELTAGLVVITIAHIPDLRDWGT